MGEEPCPITLVQCPTQPVIFRAEVDNEIFIIWVNNDNIRTYTSSLILYQKFRTWLTTAFPTTGTGVPLRDSPPQTCLGVQIQYLPERTIISMPAYIRRALAQVGLADCNSATAPLTEGFVMDTTTLPQTDTARNEVLKFVQRQFPKVSPPVIEWAGVLHLYTSMVSTIGWIAKQVGVSVSHAHSMLGRAMSAPSIQAFKAVKHVYRYLQGKQSMSLQFVRPHIYDWRSGDFPPFTISSDSSFADDVLDRKSQGGYLGCFQGLSPCYWSSAKSSRVCTSTTHAETYHACRAAKHAMYVHNLLTFLRVRTPTPIRLELDSATTVTLSGAPIRKFSPRAKHFHIDDRFIVQCVEEGIIHLVRVPGSLPPHFQESDRGFAVDALTKSLPSTELAHYYHYLHGPLGVSTTVQMLPARG